MTDARQYRLCDSIVVQPLVNEWPAWAYGLSPAVASMHLLNYQLPAMRSYLEDPVSHVRAARDPALIGGPFVDVPVDKAERVRVLLKETESRLLANIEFAQSAVDFYNWLVDDATGQSLEGYYPVVPERLRGYVELVYDYFDRAAVRFIEGALYESDYYRADLQALRLFRLSDDQARPFFMSTPHLLADDQVNWSVAFADSRTTELFKMDMVPKPLGLIREILQLDPAYDERLLLSLLTTQPAVLPRRWLGDSIRFRYFGHACVLLEWKGIAILTDPVVAVAPQHLRKDRFSYGDLPERIDFALVTHSHPDHFALESLLRLRHRIETLVVPKAHSVLHGDISLKLMARKLGFTSVAELEPFETLRFQGGEIIAIPFLGEHGDLPHAKTGYVVRAGKQKIMFAADSNSLENRIYKQIRGLLGSIETVFLGTEPIGAPLTWSYGPLFPTKPSYAIAQARRQRGCHAAGALAILEALGAKRFYNYGLGQEPWMASILALATTEDSPQIRESNRLLAQARERGLQAERPLTKGEFYLNDNAGDTRSSNVGRHSRDRRSLQGSEPCYQGPVQTVGHPLSLTQEAVWVLDFAPRWLPLVNVQSAVSVSPALQVKALNESLAAILERHHVLKSEFSSVGPEIRVNSTNRPFVVLVEDFTESAESKTSEELRALLEKERLHQFNLSYGPLIRAKLLRLAAKNQILVLTAHPIISDQSSIDLLVRDILSFYGAFTFVKGAYALQPVKQYAELAWAQREGLEPALLDGQLEFWRRQLAAARPFGEVQSRTSGARGAFEHLASCPVRLDAEMLSRLHVLENQTNTTLYLILLAAFEAVLHRHTRRSDFFVGIEVMNRISPHDEEIVGPLANAVALHADFSGNPTFRQLLERVGRAAETALENGDIPFSLISSWLRLEPPLRHSLPLQYMFKLRRAVPLPELDGIAAQRTSVNCGDPGCHLSLLLTEASGEIGGQLEYDTNHTPPREAVALVHLYLAILDQVCQSGESNVTDQPLHSFPARSSGATANWQFLPDDDDQFAF